MDGGGSTWTNERGVIVGLEGNGTLSITDGGVVSSDDGLIGYSSGSTGTVTVDGTGSTWINDGPLTVGEEGNGTLNIINGGVVINSSFGHIGISSGSTGAVTVDGADSTWTTGWLAVGRYGSGTLNITNGGQVDVDESVILAKYASGLGEIHFDNGTLNAAGLFARPTELTGTGTINTSGLVSDVDLVFDSPQSLKRTILFDSEPGQHITINMDISRGNGPLGAGMHGDGSMTIRDGVAVSSTGGNIGYSPGSTGTVTVDGASSTWTNSRRPLYVGQAGNGTLNITNGAAVRNEYYRGRIGSSSGSTGIVTVDGAGSTWTNSGGLTVGGNGYGTLNIINGGLVSVGDTLTIDYDGGADSFINMASGGMLALLGQAAGSLADFLDLIDGTDAINYWDGSGWSPITSGVRNVDYALGYIQDGGDLDGYTMLTVPEPATLALLALGALGAVRRRRGRSARRRGGRA